MPPISRRRFLTSASIGAVAAFVAACGGVVSSPSPSATGSASPSEPPTPSVARNPGPMLREKIGQMLLVGFRGLTIADSTSILADIRNHALGGVLLFDCDTPTQTPVRNVASPDQLTALVAGLQEAAATPLVVAIDEEGGLVARLDQRHGFPPTVSEQEMGERDDPVFTAEQAGAMADTLRSVGINLNLAPVVDLNVNPENPIIGSLGRSFSADPDVVTDHATAFVEAMQVAGVRCTLKHFPGHGSSTGDTHLGVVDVTDTWSRVELVPFANLVGAGLAEAVLTAHVFNSTLDPQYPATLSRATITGILRDQLGYDGVVISDDMQMGAIRDAFGYEEAVRLAIEAGIDILTIANQQVFEDGVVGRTVDLIEEMVNSGQIEADRIDGSYRRIQHFKAGLVQAAGLGQ